MGPFELIDLIGLDVNLAVSRSIHAAYSATRATRHRCCSRSWSKPATSGRRAATFYDHGAGAERPEPRTAPPARPPTRIVVEGDLGPAEP